MTEMLKTSYIIQLPIYEGPLDLLLDLIRREELDITKVALALVTNQYLAYLAQMTEHDLGDLSSFLIVAAQLLQIKSEALLPRPPQREAGEEDPGEALARQLIEYQKYKKVANHLADREEAGLRTFFRISHPPQVIPRISAGEYQAGDLLQAFLEAFQPQEVGLILNHIKKPIRINIRDKIHQIIEIIRNQGRTSFHTLMQFAQNRMEIVVSFLAMLELVKQHQIQVEQQTMFGEIEIVPGETWNADQKLEFDLEFDE